MALTVVLDGVVETEAYVSKGFAVKIPPGENFVLVGDHSCFCLSGWSFLNGFRWRVHDDLSLSLAHEEALHYGGPASIVGALEHRDKGSEAGRHFV